MQTQAILPFPSNVKMHYLPTGAHSRVLSSQHNAVNLLLQTYKPRHAVKYLNNFLSVDYNCEMKKNGNINVSYLLSLKRHVI